MNPIRGVKRLFQLLLQSVLLVANLCLSQNVIINSGWQFSEDKTYWETINLPHTWNRYDAFDDQPGYRRGFGYYQKQIFVSSEGKGQIHYLKFNAVNQEATVFINGTQIGNHKGGYTAFSMDVTPYLNYDSYNLIEVAVDNAHNVDIPPLDADFTFYGGIYRDVELISLPKQHFSLKDFSSDGFYIDYHEVSKESAEVEVTTIIENLSLSNSTNILKLELFDTEGNTVKSRTETLKLTADASNEFKVKLPKIYKPKLWSPQSPYLYRLKVTLLDEQENVLDNKWGNVGFRWASVDPDKGFILNGEPLKLIGVNRHQDYKGYGNAVPLELQKKDIHLIKNMGANVIRFGHYPHARELYNLCDELGILVWTEIPVINKVTDSKAFFEVSLNMQKEHVKQYYNHPSIVMFGYMNEIFLRLAFDRKATEEEKKHLKEVTLDLANQLESLTRKLAPNHLTVMACHLNDVYNETGIADLPMILGWNLYFGWYDAEIKDLGTFLDNQHQRFPNRSMLLSEYGPGADVRIFTKTPKKFDFSTDYQSKLHQSYYTQITERDFITGMTAWNFADFGSEFRGDAIPHVNQKGLVQYDRQPKDIYYWYKSVLDNREPFLYIASDFLSGLTLFKDETYPIQFFSNQPKGMIYANGINLGKILFENGAAKVEVPFQEGENIIRLEAGNSFVEKVVSVKKIETLDFKDFKRFGINLGSHFYFHDEERDVTFVPDQAYKKDWFGYRSGTPFGMTKDKNQGIPNNIKGTEADPLFQTMLEDCTEYALDVPNGSYQITLFFVEPQIKPTENIYNLSNEKAASENKKQRIFDVFANDQLIQRELNLSSQFPEKFGVTLSTKINVNNNQGITISLNPKEGKPVMSGILLEKLN